MSKNVERDRDEALIRLWIDRAASLDITLSRRDFSITNGFVNIGGVDPDEWIDETIRGRKADEV